MTIEDLINAYNAGYAVAKAIYGILNEGGFEVTEEDIKQIVERVMSELTGDDGTIDPKYLPYGLSLPVVELNENNFANGEITDTSIFDILNENIEKMSNIILRINFGTAMQACVVMSPFSSYSEESDEYQDVFFYYGGEMNTFAFGSRRTSNMTNRDWLFEVM